MARGDVFRNYKAPAPQQAKPLPGQLGIPGVAPNIPKPGSIGSIFAETPGKEGNAGDRRAVKMSFELLAQSWQRYMGWHRNTVAQLLREVADEL